jgi:ubiquinone/menaquinone biosynthesis C-methylase UbiE
MTVDHYARAGQRWARGAEIVYAPLAEHLIATSPHALAGRTVLDAGAGTGAASAALARCGARPVATDLSRDMLKHHPASRRQCAVADICALPLATGSVDDAVAAFVLNHLPDAAVGLAELIRVTRPHGAVLASVFSNASHSAARDIVDAVAGEAGWRAPDWYDHFKATSARQLGTASAMADAADAAGLAEVVVDERPVDVGVTEPEQLVDYRFGQAHFVSWLDQIGPERAAEIRNEAIAAIRPTMEPYRPTVIFLAALTSSTRRSEPT